MTTVRVESLEACRVCGAKGLESILSLPGMPLTDDFLDPGKAGGEFLHDLNIHMCRSCSTVQTQHNVDTADYYRDYQYAVGGSATAKRFMGLLADNIVDRHFGGRAGLRVLEVGSGDGGQLVEFKRRGARVLGVEPSEQLCRISDAAGAPTVCGLFTEAIVPKIPASMLPLDVVALSYTFDHLPDPRGFLKTVLGLLNPDTGILVVEVHDLEKILQRIEFCLFEHEHTVYLTERSASRLCELAGFQVIDFDPVSQADRRANSLIFVARPAGVPGGAAPVTPRTSPDYDQSAYCRSMCKRIETGIENLDRWTRKVGATGRGVAGYGAGGRGVMTLAAMKESGRFRYLVDRKPKHPGWVTPRSHIPVVPLDRLATDPVDHVLVFSYGYMEEIARDLAPLGYKPSQLVSMLDVLDGRF